MEAFADLIVGAVDEQSKAYTGAIELIRARIEAHGMRMRVLRAFDAMPDQTQDALCLIADDATENGMDAALIATRGMQDDAQSYAAICRIYPLAAFAENANAQGSDFCLRDLDAKLVSFTRDRRLVAGLPKRVERLLYRDDLLSIVVPCYNVQDCAASCINALLAQSYPLEKMQIIFVDDASTDDTVEIVASYAEKYPEQIMLIRCDDNGGQGRARNIGMSRATGNYLMFVDADDLPRKDLARELYHRAALYDCDVAFSSYRYLNEDGAGEEQRLPETYCGRIDVAARKKLIVEYGPRSAVWARVYRMSSLREHGIVFPENYRVEDVYFHEWHLCKMTSCYYLDEVLYDYRVSAQSASHSERIRQTYFDAFLSQNELCDRLMADGSLDGVEEEFAILFFLKAVYLTVSYMIRGYRGIAIDAEKLLLMKRELLRHFPDFFSNRYALFFAKRDGEINDVLELLR